MAAVVALVIGLILYARLRKKKAKKGAATNSNVNTSNSAMKNSAHHPRDTNKEVPMTELTKDPIVVNKEDHHEGTSISSSKDGSAKKISATEQPSSSEESSDEESAEDSSSEDDDESNDNSTQNPESISK